MGRSIEVTTTYRWTSYVPGIGHGLSYWLEAGVDVLALETIPCLAEVEALAG